MPSEFFAAAATAAAGDIRGDSSALLPVEQPTAPPPRTMAASTAPAAPRSTRLRTANVMIPPSEHMVDP
jgi:hypothetical protein